MHLRPVPRLSRKTLFPQDKDFDGLGLFPHCFFMATLPAEISPRLGVSGHPLTQEQESIISSTPDRTMKWPAFAGCAKTSTSVEYTHAWPNHKALYLAFNSSIAAEAKGRFPAHVQTQTAHSHAYQALGMSRFRDRLVARIRPHDLDACNDLLRPIGGMTAVAIQRAVIKTLQNFLISSDDSVRDTHIAGVPIQVRGAVLPMFSAIIERLMDFENNNLPISHDIYLKAFARQRIISDGYDYLIIDEAQDLNPVLIGIVQKANRPAMIVGDPWQSIYYFRGAVSAMDSFQGPSLPLSQSFRFGPKIAEVANHILRQSLEKPDHPLVGNPHQKSLVEEYQGHLTRRSTILARTNFRLFESLVKVKHPFHVIGGVDEMLNQVEAGYALFKGQRPRIIDPIVSRFKTWESCKDASEYEDEPDLVRLVRIVEQYTDNLPEILAEMRKRHVPDERKAAIVVSTAHKAKGREWPHVVVLDDFLSLTQLRGMLSRKRITAREFNQEVNLTYVTMTRAIRTLAISQPLFDEVAGGAGLSDQFWGM